MCRERSQNRWHCRHFQQAVRRARRGLICNLFTSVEEQLYLPVTVRLPSSSCLICTWLAPSPCLLIAKWWSSGSRGTATTWVGVSSWLEWVGNTAALMSRGVFWCRRIQMCFSKLKELSFSMTWTTLQIFTSRLLFVNENLLNFLL